MVHVPVKAKTTALTLPHSLSGFEPANAELASLAYATDTNKVRLMTPAGWVDVAGGGGGGGTITQVVEGEGINVTSPTGPLVTISVDFTEVAPHSHVTDTNNPHNVNKVQLGLGNVTNDAQLKRSGNDWPAFTIITPATTDRVLLEDASNSYEKGITTVASIVALAPVQQVTQGTGILVTNGTGPNVTVAANIGTTAGTVASGAHVADTNNPHAVTKAQVGLGNVTDDAQLKRSANDWGSFTSVTPAGTDRILLEDESGAYAKASCTVADLAGMTAYMVNGFRLSGSFANAITQASAPSTLYLVPYTSDRIGLYVTALSRWVVVSAVQPSIALSGLTTGSLYDVFAYSTDGSTVQMEIGAAWTTPGTRPAQSYVEGIRVLASNTSRRYIGTFRASSGTQATMSLTGSESQTPCMGIWNYHNRMPIHLDWHLVNAWTVSPADLWVRWGGLANPGFQYVVGQILDSVSVQLAGSVTFPSGGDVAMGISRDGTGSGLIGIRPNVTAIAGSVQTLVAYANHWPSTIGLNAAVPMIVSRQTTLVLQGAFGPPFDNSRNGLTAIVWG